MGFSNYVESSEISITQAGNGTVAHGFGAVPVFYTAVLRCKTTESGFAVGDEIFAGNAVNIDKTTTRGVQIHAGATNLEYQFGNSPAVFSVLDTSGDEVDLTDANWRLVLRAWA